MWEQHQPASCARDPQADAPTCFYDLYLSSLTPPYLADRCARYICIYDSFFCQAPFDIRAGMASTQARCREHTHTHTHTNVIITAPVQPLASIFCTNKSHMCTHVHAQSHVSSTFGSQDLSFSSQHVPGLLRAHKRRSISAPTARHAWQFGTHVHTIRMHVHTKYHVSSTMFSYTCIYSTCTASVAHTCRAHHDHAHPLSAPLASIFHQQTRIAGVYKHAKCESSRMPGSKVDFFLSVCVFGTLSTQHRAQKHGHLCHQRTCRHALEHTCVQSICTPSCPHSAAQNGLGAESSRELLCAVPKRLDWVGQSCTLRFVSPLPL